MYTINTETPNCLYSFTTDDGIVYGVNLCRHIDDLSKAEIVFAIMNPELFDTRFEIQNSGDAFNILDTVSESVRLYTLMHPEVTEYSFEAHGTEEEKEQRNTIYIERCIPQIFDEEWEVSQVETKVIISKIV